MHLCHYSLQLQNSLSSKHCCNCRAVFCTRWIENPSRLNWRKCTSPLSLATLLLSVCHWNNSPFLLNESISVSWFMCIFCHWVAGVIKLPGLAVCGGQIVGMCTLLGQKMTIQQFHRWAKKRGGGHNDTKQDSHANTMAWWDKACVVGTNGGTKKNLQVMKVWNKTSCCLPLIFHQAN